MKHVLETQQFDREALKELFAIATRMEGHRDDSLHGKILATLFYEPSTRTRFSFESAMFRLGGQVITAEFDVSGNTAARGWLAAQAETDADHVVLRRIVDAAGKSRAQINGRPASLAEVRELGATLLELHAQHEHQALLRSTTQRELLDRFADAANELRAVQAAWRHARDARDHLARLFHDHQLHSGLARCRQESASRRRGDRILRGPVALVLLQGRALR